MDKRDISRALGTLVRMTPEERARAGEAVGQRIAAMGSTPASIARVAKVDPKTLRAFIAGTRWPQTESRLRLEAALGWELGDALRIAFGVAPQPKGALSAWSDSELAVELAKRALERERATRLAESKQGT